MVADISNYVGREQAFVKHFFLASYLESLIYKTAGKFDEVAYVDGFSGPWQSTGEDFADTSFGIALAALRKAKASWKEHGRDVRMSAYLVEKSPSAYANLEAIKARFPDIAIPTHPSNTTYLKVWPRVLEKHVVTRVDVNQIAARLRKEGMLLFPGWEAGKRVPQDQYVVSKAL